MFDDPKKELEKLEEQLLQAESTDDDFESFYADIYKEFGPAEETEGAAGNTAVRRNTGSSGKAAPKKPQNSYGDTKRAVAPRKKEKGIRGLVITACLESLGIIAIVIWWIMRIL